MKQVITKERNEERTDGIIQERKEERKKE